MASDDLARTFTEHLQDIEQVLRLVDVEERLHAEAVVALQRRLESAPAAASPADWEQLRLLRLLLDQVRTLRANLRAQLRDLADRAFTD